MMLFLPDQTMTTPGKTPVLDASATTPETTTAAAGATTQLVEPLATEQPSKAT